MERNQEKKGGTLTCHDPKEFYNVDRNTSIELRKIQNWPSKFGPLHPSLVQFLDGKSIENAIIPGNY